MSRRIFVYATLFVLSAMAPAAADEIAPHGASGAYLPYTIGTSDSVIAAGGAPLHTLDIINNSATATLCINFGGAATISGTLCAAGEITIPPLWHRSWEGTFVPVDAVHAIASAASTPASVGAK